MLKPLIFSTALAFLAALAFNACRDNQQKIDSSSPSDRSDTSATSSLPARSTHLVKTNQPVSFNGHIQPILSSYSYHCHGSDSGSRQPEKTPLRLDKEADAFAARENGQSIIIKGNPDASYLIELIESKDKDKVMPPHPDTNPHGKLMQPEEIALLRRWVAEGATFEDHWACIPPKKYPLPEVKNKDWAKQNPIDRFIAARFEKSGLEPSSLENPFDVAYIEKHLTPTKPRLIYNQTVLDQLKSGMKLDPVIENLYQAIRREAYAILELPLTERNKTSNAMLMVSRGFLRRMNFLGLIYLVERDPVILERIDQELQAVSDFEDWNPPVYLDTAEICMAVSLALDWTLDDLPPATIATAKRALIEKGIQPSWAADGGKADYAWWVDHYNNWNQVCNGGMIAASITVADVAPQLAAKTIRRAIDGIPYVLAENYAPDGACPEGVMYWQYTTSYALLTLSILETSFGSDFGYRDYPGFMRSADFMLMCSDLPTGGFYNFADCRDGRGDGGDMVLAWFAAETGKAMYYQKEKFLIPTADIRPSYLSGAFLSWMSRYQQTSDTPPRNNYIGMGRSPVAVFRDHDDKRGFYLGAKGGAGAVSHGHMDAGSFVFELDGVRWSVDPGISNYMIGEQGFDLWKQHQESERWELLALNNHGHSTLTVDGQRHIVDGYATVSDQDLGEQPSVTFDLSPTFAGQLASASRTFTRTGPRSLRIEDQLRPKETTRRITWQLMTCAEVEPHAQGATLTQNGESLELINHSHSGLSFQIVPLDPPPHRHDKRIAGLKRIELHIPISEKNRDGDIRIRVELRGE